MLQSPPPHPVYRKAFCSNSVHCALTFYPSGGRAGGKQYKMILWNQLLSVHTSRPHTQALKGSEKTWVRGEVVVVVGGGALNGPLQF